MTRITARQAYTRAKSKRNDRRHDLDRALMEARNRYIRQLSDSGIIFQDENADNNQQMRKTKSGPLTARRSLGLSRSSVQNNTKITDFFSKSSRGRESTAKILNLKEATQIIKCNSSISIDPNGVELITIEDSDQESEYCDGNNNTTESNPANSILQDPISTSPPPDIKPQIRIASLGISFEELNLSVRVDEDIEIINMLPPIPLRDHPVFELEDE